MLGTEKVVFQDRFLGQVPCGPNGTQGEQLALHWAIFGCLFLEAWRLAPSFLGTPAGKPLAISLPQIGWEKLTNLKVHLLREKDEPATSSPSLSQKASRQKAGGSERTPGRPHAPGSPREIQSGSRSRRPLWAHLIRSFWVLEVGGYNILHQVLVQVGTWSGRFGGCTNRTSWDWWFIDLRSKMVKPLPPNRIATPEGSVGYTTKNHHVRGIHLVPIFPPETSPRQEGSRQSVA